MPNELPPIPEGSTLLKPSDSAHAPSRLPPIPEGLTVAAPESAADETNVVADMFKNQAHVAAGVVEFGTAAVTGAAASIGSGAFSALRLAFGGDFEPVKEDMDAFNDAFTYAPRTERGKQIMDKIAGPMLVIDQAVTDYSEQASFGNPYAATATKTFIMGAIELAVPTKGGAVKIAPMSRRVAKAKQEVVASAERLGVDIRIGTMKDTVVEAAKKITPDEKGANMAVVQDALREVEAIAKANKNELYDAAKEKRVWVDSRSVNDLAAESKIKLMDSFDLSEMPKLNKRLAELATDMGAGTKVKFRALENVRRKINSHIDGEKRIDGTFSEQGAALISLKKEVDGFIANEFDKTAIQAGQSKITGDVEGIQAWKDAREANRVYKENFYSDRIISDMIKKNATAETMNDWLLGATAMGARKEAASTVARIRDVVGKDHPAMEGMRQDFLFRVAEPLLNVPGKPNFNQFVANYDRMIKRNPTLVKELGLNESQFHELVVFAREAAKLPKNAYKFQITDVTKGLAVFFQGHSMAKKALRVGYLRKILNATLDVDAIARKNIILDIAGVEFGAPLFIPKGAAAGQFISGASITEMMRDQEEHMDFNATTTQDK